jgi:hypothetical protein
MWDDRVQDANRGALAVMEAFDDPAVREAHDRACTALAEFAQSLSDHDVSPLQTIIQMQGACMSVWAPAVGLE